MTRDVFAAIDFETANRSSNSACAVGLVRVEDGVIVLRMRRLIRPPPGEFRFANLHGIGRIDVAGSPPFAQVWLDVAPSLSGVSFLAAHNAAFDRSVLHACCAMAGIAPPQLAFRCTAALAKRRWRIRPASLPAVCRHLGIALRHHDPLSDAEACARILLAASEERC